LSPLRTVIRRRRRRALGMLVSFACALGLALVVLVGLPGPGGTSTAAGQSGGEAEVTPQSDVSVPAHEVTMIGSTPAEAPQETWGIGQSAGATVLVRYTAQSGWSLGPPLLDSSGQPLSGFQLAQPEGGRFRNPSPLAAEMTPDGSGALLGNVPNGKVRGEVHQVVLVRDPGGSFRETASVPEEGAEPPLEAGESLFGVNRPPLVAALDEPGGQAGALVVPVDEAGGVDDGVLHWDGHEWTREPIEVPQASTEQFEVLAIGASSPDDAWLIARLSSQYPTGSVALFRRHLGAPGETPTWRAVTTQPGGEPGEPLSVEGQRFTIPSGDQAQVLTVTGDGVWIDGLRRDAQAPTTLFFKPEGEAGGSVLTAWCEIPANAPEGTPPCQHTLPESLPTGPSRSFAWAGAANGGLGERVITGLADGTSLRLEGSDFVQVLSLGGEEGAGLSAAFSSAKEGWLGKAGMPVHLTVEPLASRLTAWPVSFRDALLALAPQPGTSAGSLASEALAVGDQGEVARYRPGQGWLPESLLGPGGKRERPRLRAVAWPTPGRAYAVGDVLKGLGQMWRWRGETGLWEPDPAEPPNFRGNLLGISFEPGNPNRGYAVGQQGVLLRYGKTWEQEPEEALPPQARGASFTSIAFAGAEAIVAFRKLVSTDSERYVGGLIVNEGSGWHLDEGADAAMGLGVPWAVAGLPDGGAAFSASGSSAGTQIFERQDAGAPWQATSTPFPGTGAPGALALFREGGALRAIAAGTQPNTYAVEREPPPPPGSPPTLIEPYPVESNSERGLLRQMPDGWSDEEHELNNAKEPPGGYAFYDTAYQPDPVAAVLVDPTGTLGWAVGGIVEGNPLRTSLDTADVYRYPDASAPVGTSPAPVATEPGTTAIAIAGGAQCAAPCADRARTDIGPDVWLATAMARAKEVARAFVYTGPRVTTGETAGPATLVVPYERELARYAQILGASPGAFAAASPTDLDGGGSEGLFTQRFGGFPFANQPCETPPCQSAFYSFSTGGVRVIVLDDSDHDEVGPSQRSWLQEQLASAANAREPAIVAGHGNLSAQVQAGDSSAAEVARVLIGGGASAYFFDAPEKNVQLPLRFGAGSIPSFGSGTLGYVSFLNEQAGKGFIGAAGFLLAQVDVKHRAANNVAPVSVKLIPNVGELAMEADDGTLLRRSQAALFAGLARRPRAGSRAHNEAIASEANETNPYIPIPSNCRGTECANGLLPEYEFTSSNPEVGAFVKPNLASGNVHAVELGSNGKPIAEAKSGLFCAYNPGTTVVTLRAGGLSYSLPVTVQAGSVGQPCGTTPLSTLPARQSASPPVPAPAPAPAPAAAPPSAAPPLPVPPPPTLAPALVPAAHAAPQTGFFLAPALPAVLIPFVPPPVPTPARPTPPSGTSAVTSPVEAPEREEEEEAAPESVSNEAVAYRAPEHEPSPAYILGIVLLAAFAGAAMRGRPGRRGREVRVAPATLSSMRAQRRMSRHDQRFP
jgi:hypothetical protein